MSTLTPRASMTKAASSENVDVTAHITNNLDIIDGLLGATVATSGSRPASAVNGRLWYTTDTTKFYVNTAASASAAASWADPVANALLSSIVLGGSVAASGGSIDVTRAAGSSAFSSRVTADSQARLLVTTSGSAIWGSGSATGDTNLYRSAADTLKTDDSMVVGGGLTVVGAVAASSNMTVTGSLTAGGITSTGKGAKTYVRKPTTQGRASTTTVADDSAITFALAASAVYQLTAYLAIGGAAAGDFKCKWNITGAASGGDHTTRYANGPPTNVTSIDDTNLRWGRHNWGTEVAYGLDGTSASHVEEGGLLDTTTGGSGTITLQWAQNSSSATSTTVSSNSWAVLERLA